MEGGICTGGIDVKVFVVIAHDGIVLGYDVSITAIGWTEISLP